MRRSLWLVLAFASGAAVGFVAAPGAPLPAGAGGPPIDWSSDFSVTRGVSPAVTYRPHGATYRGREWFRRDASDLRPDQVVVFRFPPGVQVSCTEVAP